MWFWCRGQRSLWVLWGLWLDMGLWLFEIFSVGAFVLGLRWCVTGILPTSWSHEEECFMGFETFNLIDIYVTVNYSVNLQPLFNLFSTLVFFVFFFLLLLHTRKWNNFFPLLVWTIWIVFKFMNEVYNLIDLRKYVNS